MADSLFTMPFGQFKGKDIEDLRRSHLAWLTGEKFFCEKYPAGCKAVATELKYRDRWGEPDK